MASIVVSGDTSGSITVSAPAVAGSNTLTLPAVTDTLVGLAATQTLTNKTISNITSAAATALTLQSAGTTAMTIDTSQNVGIGTTSPAAKLDVRGSSTYLVNATNPTAWVSVDSALTTGSMYNQWNTTSSVGISGTYTNHAYTFVINNTERARIDTSGNLCVGRSSVGVGDRFVVQAVASGTIMLGYNSSATNTYQVLDSGNVRNTNNSYGAISDQRRKENIVDATPKLEKLNQVRIVNFNMIGDEQKQIGVIAQELEQIFPSMVEEDSDGMKAVKYSVFVPMLIKAIQEQQAIIEQLKARIEALESK